MYFFICDHCGNLVISSNSLNSAPVCCGENMKQLTPQSSGEASPKHLPIITLNKNLVTINVGQIQHPMTSSHFIKTIILVTNLGYQVKHLKFTDEPSALFSILPDESPIKAFALCNLHGLWVNNEIKSN